MVSCLRRCFSASPTPSLTPTRSTANPSRRLLVAILIDSWVFIFSAALMTSGIGLSLNSTICGGAIFLCIVFYGLSKVLIYMFLGDLPFKLPDSPPIDTFYGSQPSAFIPYTRETTASIRPRIESVSSFCSVLESSSRS